MPQLAGTRERDAVVDFVRASALLVVVAGHWLKQGLYVDPEGVLHRSGLLGREEWTHPLTWALQVMPLFFLVGGYVNALSWRHSRARGESYGDWLSGRVGRMTRPLMALLGFWTVAAATAAVLDTGHGWLMVGSRTAFTVTWFIAVYVVVVALVPLTERAWRRFGWWTLAAGAAGAALGDALSIVSGNDTWGALNVVFVWGCLHQLGYAWVDGRIARRGTALGLALGGLGAALALVVIGPYGVSMVGVSGFGLDNTNPPRLTILALGAAQAGLVVLLAPTIRRFMARPWAWRCVILVEARTMTIYLWHLTAVALLAAASMAAGGWGLHDLAGTRGWWASRPLWFVALSAVTIVLVAAAGSAEKPRPHVTGHENAARPIAEVAVVVAGVSLLALGGLSGELVGVPRWWLAPALLSALVVLHRPRGTDRRPAAAAAA